MTCKLFIYLCLALLFIGCVPENKIKVNGLKDKTAPVISLSNLPTIINASSSSTVNISVTSADSDFAHYIYKIGNSSLDCSDTSGYSAEILPATPITDDVASFSSNSQSANTKICIIAIDNNLNRSKALAASWIVDTTTPVAVISGTPAILSNTTLLNIAVASTNSVASYKYKVGESASTDCSDGGGYSAAISRAIPITDDISALGDEALKICVVGVDFAGNEQDQASATSFEWTKDTSAPTAVLSGVPTIIRNSSSTILNIAVTATLPADILSYQYKIGTAVLDCTDPLLYSSNNLIISNIVDDIASFTTNSTSNNTKICVLAVDALGNVQDYSLATTASWLTDTEVPVAALTNAPVGDNLDSVLNITVSAAVPADIVTYKYKIGTSTLDCSASGGYSAAIARTTNITNSLTGYSSETNIKICVLALDSAGNQQAFASATTTSWTRYTACNNALASFGGGFGAAKVPYLIYNVTQLQQVKNNAMCAYKLMANIDLAGVTFTPIGTSGNTFRGIFDGNNFAISNWTYNAPTTDYVGFFGVTNTATIKTLIKDLSLVNINVTGRNFTGGMVGYGFTGAIIRSSVSGSVSGTSYVGGLIGYLGESFFSGIYNSFSSANVTGTGTGPQAYFGGLVGYVRATGNSTRIKNSYSSGNVNGMTQNAGGLIGYFYSRGGSFAVIENSYSSGNVTATNSAGLSPGIDIGNKNRAFKNSFSVSTISGTNAGVGKITTDFNGPNFPFEGVYWDLTRSGKNFCLVSSTPAECTGVNSANSNPNYFYNSANAPFFSGGTQNWNTGQIWNFSGSSLPTLRPNSPVAPILDNIAVSASPNQVLTINMGSAGFSFDGHGLTYEIVTGPTHGTLSSVTANSAVYIQNDAQNFSAFTDSFTFRAVDSNGLFSNTATVTISVSASCDPASLAYSGGAGTVTNPYLISSPSELVNIHKSGNCSYRLIADIDLAGVSFSPIATTYAYSATFDGNNFEISNFSFTGATTDLYLGLFGRLSGATIKDLTLTNINFNPSNGIVSYTGALAAYSTNSTISNCHSSGEIITTSGSAGGLIGASSNSYIYKSSSATNVQTSIYGGGLAGTSLNDTIVQSYASGDISSSNTAAGFIGTFTISSDNGFGIVNSYSTGNATATNNSGGFIGQLNGYNEISEFIIQNCYSSGNAQSQLAFAGGFVGRTYYESEDGILGILNSFSIGEADSISGQSSGFAGYMEDEDAPSIPSQNIFWDISRSGLVECNEIFSYTQYSDCTGVNSANSQPNYFFNNSTNAPLNSWDFTNIWRTNPGALPTLR